jgi:hypothetical protein
MSSITLSTPVTSLAMLSVVDFDLSIFPRRAVLLPLLMAGSTIHNDRNAEEAHDNSQQLVTNNRGSRLDRDSSEPEAKFSNRCFKSAVPRQDLKFISLVAEVRTYGC